MRKGLLGSFAALLVGTGLARAELPTAQAVPAQPGGAAPSEPLAMPALPPATAGQPATQAPASALWFAPAPHATPGQFYTSADYLLWWTKGQRLPILVTTSSATDIQSEVVTSTLTFIIPGSPGLALLPTTSGGAFVNGDASARTLFGGNEVDDQARSGARLTLGYWLDSDETVGIEARAFYLEPQSTHFAAASNGSQLLAMPFFDPFLGTVGSPSAYYVANPEITAFGVPFIAPAAGSVAVSTSTHFWGAEADGRCNVLGKENLRADVLFGFRYLRLSESLNISSNSASPSIPGEVESVPGPVLISDSVSTRNDFYGGQIGGVVDYTWRCLTLNVRAAIGVGDVHQVADLAGATIAPESLVPVGGVNDVRQLASLAQVSTQGGLYVQGTNAGHHVRDEIGVVPEVGVNLAYQATNHIRVTFGYSVIYMRSDTLAPGEQLDQTINVQQAPVTGFTGQSPPQRPSFTFKDSDFWAQGINAGIEFSF